jgi:hypothetical protein
MARPRVECRRTGRDTPPFLNSELGTGNWELRPAPYPLVDPASRPRTK